MSKIISVGISDLNIVHTPDRIKTTGLGSCVGVGIFDPIKKLAGLVHIMLPSSDIARNDVNLAKYADTAIPALLELMEKQGGIRSRFQAKLAGGAQMFKFQMASDTMRIGPRNVEASKHWLTMYNIPIVAEDTGGNCGRTIELRADTGVLSIRTVNHGIKEV